MWVDGQADDFHDDEQDERDASARSDLDTELRIRLEHELGQAEASVLRLRAELGYSLSNHLTGTSTRLEKIARVRSHHASALVHPTISLSD